MAVDTDVLSSVRGSRDLRLLDSAELAGLAARIRRYLVERVCRTGGHLGPNLGVVELTIALHRVFDSPRDPILWDTGHQAYVHKLLTGRVAEFARLRQAGGLSGYPSRVESEHDFIENSHASTALSYADGMAKAFRLRGEHDRTVVAVVGDGALTGGMCWEALNNIGAAGDRPLVVVVNDNGRSYAPTVGGFAEHLTRLRTRRGVRSLFEDIGLDYLGPVDGHDLEALEEAFTRARDLRRPVVVHCVTEKGRGYRPAETDEADRFHAIGVVDPSTGRPAVRGTTSWTDVFGSELLNLADRRDDLVGITAAMLRPTGLHPLARRYPHRVVDVGMAEQHAVTSAAGMAMAGLHPVVAIYATFLNRAFDQALMDVALHRLPVTFVLDRAGVTGEDGPSHHGMWDLSLFRLLPGVRIAAPRDAATLRRELAEAVDVDDGPTLVRFPKGPVGPDVPAVDRIGGLDVLRQAPGGDILLVSVGAMAPVCLATAELLARHGIGVTVVDPRWVVPVDPALLPMARDHRLVAVVEDGHLTGGVGSAVADLLRDHDIGTRLRTFGLAPRFLAAGKRQDLLAEQGLHPEALARQLAGSLDAPDWPVPRAEAGRPRTETEEVVGR
ncbi:1-deoxy-D-xylulose-5-phosphate synthase [Streptomyces phyllanthi]|uniref:1-deoxy-D-xylulose-5-phosphate synthase n=1 Tax=Streptomyces phyllanthi TaxID=1803180 RepID=A0A5N8W473_9ACTN|nr:1-deoxy-D-xylulose-5-phosphate synthase [Streptomyces phyllanthi]MPY40955.1 1-deoxy-D-xylulose-5-phosphate synthase [Streptomyces phyllanthi]